MTNTRIEILSAAMKTRDPNELLNLIEKALELAEFNGAQLAFSRANEKKLREQVERQTAMIENLEKTLWGKQK